MTYGSQVEERDAIEIIAHAIDGGVNFSIPRMPIFRAVLKRWLVRR